MLRVEREGHTAVWTLDRPEAKNALDRATLEGLERACDDAAVDASLRAVVLGGAGGDFAAGGDLRQLRAATTAADARAFSEAGARVCAKMGALPVPVIAAVSGVAFGGGAELMMACDVRVCDATARISFKQVRMAVTPAWGTTARLVACVGHGAASRLLLTAQEIGAEEARALGVVEHVAQGTDTAHSTAMAWARDVAAAGPKAVAEMKALLRTAREQPPRVDAEERERFVATWTSDDHREAVEAYFERRAPKWR